MNRLPGRMTDRLSRQASETYPVHIAGSQWYGSQWYDRCDRQEVEVPLSDNEQRLLEQMERALYAEDPKFASAMRGANRRPGAARRLAIGGTGIVLGLVILVYGVSQSLVWVGVLGFVCMLAGTAYAVSSQRRGPLGVVNAAGTVRPPARSAARNKASFMQRLEQRWDRRRDER
jgi:hypothetical protein